MGTSRGRGTRAVRAAAAVAVAGVGVISAARWDSRRPTKDQLRVRPSGAMKLLPLLPRSVSFALVRRARQDPPARLGAVEQDEAGGVRLVWLNRSLADRGVIVFVHGGAYVLGPVIGQWQWMAALSEATSMAVVAVHYRMAPDDRHPAAVDDVVGAVAALQDAGTLVPGRWALAGDSAGGGLALAACHRLRDDGHERPAGILLAAPWVDMELTNPAIPATEDVDPILGRGMLRWAADLYAGATSHDDPLLSPVHADLAGVPPVHLSVGTHDILVHDVRLLRQRMDDAAVSVEYVEEPGAVHVYPMFVGSPEARRTIADQAAFLHRNLG